MKKRLVQIGVLLIPALLLTALALAYTAHQCLVVRKTVQQLQIKNKQQVAKIQRIIAQHKQDLESVAHNSAVKNLIMHRGPWPPTHTKQLHDAVTDLNAVFQFKNVVFLTKKGRVLFTLDPHEQKETLSHQEKKAFHTTLRLKKTTLFQLEPYESFEGVRAWVAAPIFHKGKAEVVAVATLETETFHDLVSQPSPNEPMETMLAFAQDKHLRVMSNHPLQVGLSNQTMAFGDPRAESLEQALQGKQGAGEKIDINGVDTLAAWQAVPQTPVVVVTQIARQRVLWPVLRIYLTAAGVALLIHVLCLLLLQSNQKEGNSPSPYLPNMKWAVNAFLWQLLLVFALATIRFSLQYHKAQEQLLQGIHSQTKFQLLQASQHITQRIKKIEKAAQALADKLSAQHLIPKQMGDELRQIVQKHPEILGIGAAYKPYAYEKNLRLYAPYMVRKSTGIRNMQVEETYDYTLPESPGKPKTNWYNNPLKTNQPQWLKPYFGSASRELLSSYVVPFYSPQDKQRKHPVGVVEIMQNLKGIRQLASAFSLHGTGYPFILNGDGTYTYHPLEEYVHQQTPVKEISNLEHQTAAKHLMEKISKNKSQNIFSSTQGSSWTYAARIHGTNWIFAINFQKSSFENLNQSTKQLLAKILLCFFAFVFFAISICIRFLPHIKNKSHMYSLAFSAAAGCAIAFLWAYMLAEPPQIHLTSNTPIFEQAEVDRYIAAFTKTHRNHASLTRIPTGISIESIEFVDFLNARVSGYCWQKYKKNKQLTQGIVFSNATQSRFQEVYREDKHDFEVVGWSFTANLIQRNDHWRYPLDDQNVILFLENADLNADAILTPDSDSYEFLNPESTPGISPTMKEFLPIRKSLFLYTKQRPASTFGLMKTSNLRDIPNLAFAIGIKRSIINPIVFYYIPLITILLCIYFSLLMQERIARGDLINAYLTLLFTAILLHQALRREMQAREIFYIEHFLMSYYAIFLLIFSSVFLESRKPAMDGMKNVLRLAFWPFTLTSWLFSTVYVFLN